MVQYVGLDLHKEFVYASILNNKGEKILEEKIDNKQEALKSFLEELDKDAMIAMESCSFYEPVYDLIEEKGFHATLAHPKKVKAIAEARIKTDKISAEILAQLLRMGWLPSSYVPEKDVREIRTITRHRESLVKLRRQVKHMMHAILHREGIKHEFSDLFGVEGIEWLKSIKLKDSNRTAMNNYLGILYIINAKINMENMHIASIVNTNPHVKLLTTAPGIAAFSALTLASEIGDIHRFSHYKKICSYFGLVPSVYQSGNTKRFGSITKEGSRIGRWILIQCANAAIKTDKELRKFYNRIERKKGHRTAIVAVARKLLVRVYWMLKKEVDYNTLRELAS